MNFASQHLLLPSPSAFLFREKLSGRERTTGSYGAAYASRYEKEQRFTSAFFLVVPDKITHLRDEYKTRGSKKKPATREKKETLWREEMPMKSERKAEERLLTSTISPDRSKVSSSSALFL